jgi:hypothetical protein
MRNVCLWEVLIKVTVVIVYSRVSRHLCLVLSVIRDSFREIMYKCKCIEISISLCVFKQSFEQLECKHCVKRDSRGIKAKVLVTLRGIVVLIELGISAEQKKRLHSVMFRNMSLNFCCSYRTLINEKIMTLHVAYYRNV